ncbi:MAG TPA: hypothetical protein VHM19_16010 [Polyangiales bacterium]|nr:hypothetical protein [Polyangiales bacterium]
MKIARSIGSLLQQGVRGAMAVAGRASAASRADTSDQRSAEELELLELLAEDFAVYDGRLTEPGLWAVVAHRLGSHGTAVDSELGKRVFAAAHRMLSAGVDTFWGIDLPGSVRLGRRVRLWHSGCMRLHAKSIGDDVSIRHDTTLGPMRLRNADGGPSEELPTIESRVELGSGVCVLGDVRVGHDAMVGANSLVIKDVPPAVTAMGVPARIIPS